MLILIGIPFSFHGDIQAAVVSLSLKNSSYHSHLPARENITCSCPCTQATHQCKGSGRETSHSVSLGQLASGPHDHEHEHLHAAVTSDQVFFSQTYAVCV